jgi:hypothetical protein
MEEMAMMVIKRWNRSDGSNVELYAEKGAVYIIKANKKSIKVRL